MSDSEIEYAADIWRAHETPLLLAETIDRTTEERWSASTAWAGKESGKVKRIMGYHAMWAWQWAEDGFWSFSAPHTYAAAMMATKCDGYLESVTVPGRAMRFSIPDGILSNGDYHYRYCYTLDMPGMCSITIAEGPLNTASGLATNFSVMSTDAVGIEELLCRDSDLEPVLSEHVPELVFKERALLFARRFAVGLLYTMQNTTNWSERRKPVGGQASNREPPSHRNVVVGAPLKLDARPQIKSWLRGGTPRQHGAPSLQHIVRGHYKRQVIGEGRANRKVIWVEPYWRGPEGAPILIRERRIA